MVTQNSSEAFIRGMQEANLVQTPEVDVNLIAEIFSINGVYANKIFISVDQCHMARIVFAEDVPERLEVKARAAIVMPVQGLLALKSSIDKTVDNHVNMMRMAEHQTAKAQRRAHRFDEDNTEETGKSE